ncbi:MAG: hypothetical protein WBG46_03000 [Nonlabens sp.]
MENQIKNTVYRFTTLRAPQLSSESFKENFLITKGDLGVLTTDLANVESVTKIKDLTELKSKYSQMYELGNWLARNSNYLEKSELADKISNINVTHVEGEEDPRSEAWDNLLLYTFVEQNPYVRDGIISVLKAFHVVQKWNTVDSEFKNHDDDVSAYARSIVILPVAFKNEVTAAKSERIPAAGMVTGMDKSVAIKADSSTYENLLKEVNDYQSKIERINSKNKESYDADFELRTQEAYKYADKIERVITDPETGATKVVIEYKDLELPSYDFKPINTFDKNFTPVDASSDFNNLLPSVMASESLDTVREAVEHLEGHLEENDRDLLEHLDNPDDREVLLPIRDGQASFCFSRIEKTNNWTVTLSVRSFLQESIVERAIYHFKDDSSTGATDGTFRINSSDPYLQIQLFVNKTIDISRFESFEGEISLGGGTILKWDFELDFSSFNSNFCTIENIQIESDDRDIGNEPTIPNKPIIDYGIKRLGIADYRRVEQEICCYVPGEVSHIENVMAREFKQKTTRRLRRQEDTETTSTETERENLTENSSTDRFEMNQEIASMTAQDRATNFAAGVQYSTNIGGNLVTSANANISNASSQESSNSQAVSHAKDMTERALERVVEKVSRERVRKVVEEFEETTDHGYDNRKGNNHISGVYRWVDKIYDNKVVNYGKRLMYEFMIPEPASLHNVLLAQAAGNTDASNLKAPVDPRKFTPKLLKDASVINNSTAQYWASYFNVEIKPEPANKQTVTEAFSEMDQRFTGKDGKMTQFIDATGKIELPEGYKAKDVEYTLSFYGQGFGGHRHIALALGKEKFVLRHSNFDSSNNATDHILDTSGTLSFTSNDYPTGTIKYSLLGAEGAIASGSFKIECILTPQAREQWQLETFKSIMDGYEKAQAAYEEKVAELNAQTQEKIRLNPMFYREIEKNVLKKNCLDYLLGSATLGSKNLINDDGAVTRNDMMEAHTSTAQFFEQAFEWNIMSYQFYPFFWAYRDRWADKYTQNSEDTLFNAFLKSGMARVFLTVRPGFEAAVNFYMGTGKIWEGGDAPQIEDEEFISIAEDLGNIQSVVEETWTSRVPTALTVLQAGTIGLNVEGLPCNPDCNENLFESDKNPIAQTNALIGGKSEKYVHFIYKGFEFGYGASSISDWDNDDMFPVIYKLNDREIVIERDASWNATDSIYPVMQKLASELSFIPGVKAKALEVAAGENASKLLISFDSSKYPLFVFDSSPENGHFDEDYDRLRIKTSNSSILFDLKNYASERLFKVGGGAIEANVDLDIEDFLI